MYQTVMQLWEKTSNTFNLSKAKKKKPKHSEQRSEVLQAYLPHGFNSFFEEMEVTVACQVPRTYHVVVKPPELLCRGKNANLFDILFIALWAGVMAGGSSGVSESILVLQEMLCWSRGNSLPLTAALTLVSFHFFLLCAVFFILIMVPTVIIFQCTELVHPLPTAVTTASQSDFHSAGPSPVNSW